MKIFNFLQTTIRSSRQGIRDVSISMIPQIVGIAIGFVSSILIARGLGPSGLGRYALIISFSSLAASLSDLGISQTAVRYASLSASQGNIVTQMAVLRWSFRLRCGIALLSTISFYAITPFLSAYIWHDVSLSFLLRLSLLGCIFSTLTAVPSIYLLSLKRFGTNTLVNSGQRLISFIGILFISWLNLWSLFNVVVVTLAASALGALSFLMLVPKAALWSPNVFPQIKKFSLRTYWSTSSLNQIKKSNSLDIESPNRFAFFNFLATIIVLLTINIDIWLMGYFLEPNQIGLYSAATRFTMPLTIILGGITTALWPRVSSITDLEKLLYLLKKTFFVCLFVALIGTVYAIFFPLLAPLLFGVAYKNSTQLGQLLSLRYCFSILTSPIGIIGYNFGLVRVYWLINLLQLFVVVSVNILLLPKIGAMGSAIALIACDVTGFCIFGPLIYMQALRLGKHSKSEQS